MAQPLWTPAPERVAQSNMMRFMTAINEAHGLSLNDYDSLYEWSTSNIAAFLGGDVALCRDHPHRAVHLGAGKPGHARRDMVSGRQIEFCRELAALSR